MILRSLDAAELLGLTMTNTIPVPENYFGIFKDLGMKVFYIIKTHWVYSDISLGLILFKYNKLEFGINKHTLLHTK